MNLTVPSHLKNKEKMAGQCLWEFLLWENIMLSCSYLEHKFGLVPLWSQGQLGLFVLDPVATDRRSDGEIWDLHDAMEISISIYPYPPSSLRDSYVTCPTCCYLTFHVSSLQ